MRLRLGLAGLMIVLLAGCNAQTPPTASQATAIPTQSIREATMSGQSESLPKSVTATIKTNRGTIVVKLYLESAPQTVTNFINKARSGFYQGLTFHRVEDWVIQGGDPDGNGNRGGDMPTELSEVPFKLGSLGVARAGDIKVSNDSQFFVCIKDCAW